MGERPTALVTGASGGLGKEFARLFARDGHDLVLVARGGAAMEELAHELEERHGIEAIVLPKDLGEPDAAREIAENLGQRGVTVDVLVNNAGFSQFGAFAELDEDEMLQLLGVNVVALTQLTRRFLPGMLERGRGMVVNLSSNAAFQPGPTMAAYYASKAYVLNFSLALTEEVRGTGVSVTALCPGTVATGFQARASMQDSKLIEGRTLPSAAEAAEWGYGVAKARKPFAVEGARWRLFAFGTRLMPRPMAARIAMKAQARTGH
jgi:short-subunit dehydrogenase